MLLTSGLCRQAQLESPNFQRWAVVLREPHMALHRKLWEWCFITQALHERGMLQAGKRGLGFAVGREPLPAYFAHYGATIVASDLFEDQAHDAGWIASNQHAASLEALNERRLCDPMLFRERVTFGNINMNEIPDHLQGFDFLWSSCSLEHLGLIEYGLNFIHQAMNCLRPNGVAVHTTEFNLSSNNETLTSGPTVLFRLRDIERLASDLRSARHAISIDFTEGDGFADEFVDLPPYTQEVHLRLQIAQYKVTSIGLIITSAAEPTARRFWSLPWRTRRTTA